MPATFTSRPMRRTNDESAQGDYIHTAVAEAGAAAPRARR
jgi:hypothetical protein